MSYTQLQNALRVALDSPTVANRLAASLALEDFADSKDERIEELEALLRELERSPRTPQWIVDECREGLAMDGDEYIAYLDKGREWPVANNE